MVSPMNTLAVTSPTGKIGQHVLHLARASGLRVRALHRDPQGFTEKADETAPLDFDDSATFGPALRGADVLALAAAGPNQIEREIAVIDAARASGVRHVIKISWQCAEGATPLGRTHLAIENHLRAAGIAFTILRPTFFMQSSLIENRLYDASKGVFAAPIGDAKIGQIDTCDIADVVVAVASNLNPHAGKTYVLTGSDALTGSQIAETLARELDRSVRYVPVPPSQFREAALAASMPLWLVDLVAGVYADGRSGDTAELSDNVRNITGKAPRDIATFIRDHRAEIIGTLEKADDEATR